MKYAIVAAAWLIAWGVGTPQGADAGFVLSVTDAMTAAVPLRNVDLGVDTSGAPAEHHPPILLLDDVLGTLQFPCGTQAPTNSRQLTMSVNVLAVAESATDRLCQSSLSSQLPPDRMFSLAMLFKSAVFRPPRA
jgi:hypothetical protein